MEIVQGCTYHFTCTISYESEVLWSTNEALAVHHLSYEHEKNWKERKMPSPQNDSQAPATTVNYSPRDWTVPPPFIWDWLIIAGNSMMVLAFAPKLHGSSMETKLLVNVCGFSSIGKDKPRIYFYLNVKLEEENVFIFTPSPFGI